MKIRNGFVSNSSSSSFIIGIAVVNDITKCKQYIEKHKIGDDVKIATYKELKEMDSWTYQVREGKDVSVESFDDTTVSIDARDLKDGTFILTYCFFGNEGDGMFCCNDDYDVNYDMVEEDNFFNKPEEDVMKMLGSQDAGLDDEQRAWTIGASRNG